ncbi:MAG: hypothetical protein ABIF10_06970 [Candidatus Woesearchaeota archaeon]
MPELVDFISARTRLRNPTTDLETIARYRKLAEMDPVASSHRLYEHLQRLRPVNKHGAHILWNAYETSSVARLLNIYGLHYEHLSKCDKIEGLRQCMDYFGEMFTSRTRTLIGYLNEPLLVADIIVNRESYFPDYCFSYQYLRANTKTAEFAGKLPEFGLAGIGFALMTSEDASLPIFHRFFSRVPSMLDNTVTLIAARIFSCVNDQSWTDYEEMADGVLWGLKDSVLKKIREKKWIDLTS